MIVRDGGRDLEIIFFVEVIRILIRGEVILLDKLEDRVFVFYGGEFDIVRVELWGMFVIVKS